MSSVLSSPSLVSAPLAAANRDGYVSRYQVSLTLDPVALGHMRACYIELLLGPNGSPGATAKLTNFVITGGGIISPTFHNGASGDFKTGITLQCWPNSGAPQVLGTLDPATSQISFNLWLQAKCTKPDWFTFRLYDHHCVGFPTTAGNPGLFASVSWTTGGTFTPAGYAGNGQIDGVSDTGFSGQVTL